MNRTASERSPMIIRDFEKFLNYVAEMGKGDLRVGLSILKSQVQEEKLRRRESHNYVAELGEGDLRTGPSILKRHIQEEKLRRQEYLKDNVVYAVFLELGNYENPLDMLRPDDPVHRALMRLMMEGGHINVPIGEANRRAKEVLQEELFRSSLQPRSRDIHAVPPINQKRLERVKELFKDHTIPEIAAKIGFSTSTVKRDLEKLGLGRRKR